MGTIQEAFMLLKEENVIDENSNEYKAAKELFDDLERRSSYTDPIEIDNKGRYQFAVRHWGSWEVPQGEYDDGDYDWKTLTEDSWNILKAKMDSLSDEYNVRIYCNEGEKCWLYFLVVAK